MSNEEKPIEFSAFDLMPDWAREDSKPKEKKSSGRRDREGGDRDDRGESRDRRGGKGRREYRDDRSSGRSGGRPGGRDFRSGDRRGGDRRGGNRHGGDRRGGDRRDGRRGDRRGGRDSERPREEKPAAGLRATVEPTQDAVDALARHIRETLRAFPIADLAKALLRGRDRYEVRFQSEEGGPSMFRCKGDSSLWLSREEAIAHMLRGDNLRQFYDVEEVEIEPPSGNFSAIAICGMSGEILGPPNHHEYQRNVARLHAERFSNMPLERFKSRIVMESGEEAVEKWREKVSRRLQYRIRSEEEPPAGESEEAPAGDETAVSEDEGVEEAGIETPAEGAAEPEGSPQEEETDGAEATEEEATPEEATAEEAAPEETPDETETYAEAEDSAAPVDEEGEEPEGPEAADEEGESTEDAEAADEEAEASEEDAESETVAEEPEADEPEAAQESSAGSENDDRPVIDSPEELARHFRSHFAGEAVEEVRDATVAGNIPGSSLSRGLLAHLKNETEALRRGFPLPMVQSLCREFEKSGLRFFKRGKKALHVSQVRPRPIDDTVSFTAQIQAIVDEIVRRNGVRVLDLLDSLADDFTKPEGKDASETPELTEGARAVLKDVRWLTSAGYVIELPDTRLVLGRSPRPQDAKGGGTGKPKSKKKAAPAGKSASKARKDAEADETASAEKPEESAARVEPTAEASVESAPEAAEVAPESETPPSSEDGAAPDTEAGEDEPEPAEGTDAEQESDPEAEPPRSES